MANPPKFWKKDIGRFTIDFGFALNKQEEAQHDVFGRGFGQAISHMVDRSSFEEEWREEVIRSKKGRSK
jgi:hypothetical protein